MTKITTVSDMQAVIDREYGAPVTRMTANDYIYRGATQALSIVMVARDDLVRAAQDVESMQVVRDPISVTVTRYGFRDGSRLISGPDGMSVC
jgi:hypothetical protein